MVEIQLQNVYYCIIGGVMKYMDHLSRHYSEILDGVYECVDRIVINGYFIKGYIAGGFRNWWRALKGSEDDLDTTHLMRMAGRFSRRIHAFTDKKGIPLIYCEPKERKHLLADQYIPEDKNFSGIFLILVNRHSGHAWEVEKSSNGKIRNIAPKRPYPFLNHYSFHIMDKDWGHITISMCSHPPFGVRIILNGHEWVEREALRKKIAITKEGNCFTSFEDSRNADTDLCNIAETLYKRGHLQEVCDRWVYLCLWFGLNEEEQEKSGFYYQYSLFQAELSRNFLFRSGRQLDEIYQNIIDLNRRHLDVKKLTTIFGFKKRPQSRKHRKTSFQVRIEKPKYNMTVFKILDGKITIKIYDKGERVLRIEVVCHNLKDMKGKRKRELDDLPTVMGKFREILESFINVLYFSHVSFIDKGEFDQLSQPSKKGKGRIAGINLDKVRCRNVMKVVVELSTKPGGFTTKDVAVKYAKIAKISDQSYNPRNASYDMRKLEAKGLVERKEKSRKYRITAKGIAMIVATIVIREKIFKPIVAGINKKKLSPSPQNLSKVDQIYISVRDKILDICNHFGVVGVIM
jgi:predicted transcriptional regulator